MEMTDWIQIAKDVQDTYEAFDGFVILHGTDTLAYTASALSFMLENLGKPVIVTGSQIPSFETRSDGRDNFVGALILAGNFNIPEVSVYFRHQLLRGNRTVKVSSENLEAFQSPNMKPLAEMKINIEVDYKGTVFENSDKILTFVSLRVDVNFEIFADAFSLLENSYKFLPILFILYNRRIEKNFQGANKHLRRFFLGY